MDPMFYTLYNFHNKIEPKLIILAKLNRSPQLETAQKHPIPMTFNCSIFEDYESIIPMRVSIENDGIRLIKSLY